MLFEKRREILLHTMKRSAELLDRNLCLKGIVLPGDIEEIPPNHFFGCVNLTEITIPASVRRIGEYAFYGCINLRRVIIPENSILQEIGEYAFALNTSLAEFVVPGTVRVLGMAAFRFCRKLQRITFAENGELRQIGSHLLQNCSSLEEVSLPDGIRSLPISTFHSCCMLQSVTARGVTKAEPYVFGGDYLLEHVMLGAPEEVDALAFEDSAAMDPEAGIVQYVHEEEYLETIEDL